MTNTMSRVSAVLAVAVLAACGADKTVATRRHALLSDARTDGVAGFYFLPPVAPQPKTESENDPGLKPVVEIVALDVGRTVLATFEGDAVKESGAHYMVHWSTKKVVPIPGTTYRIRVLLDGVELGFAEAAVAKNGRELRMLASDEVFGLTGQRTVPIKFRIHDETAEDPCEGVVCDAPTQCQVSVSCDPALAACVATAHPPGIACDDANPCTVGDACDGEGGCAAGTGSPCEDIDACNVVAGCDPAAGCLYDHLVGTPCPTTINGNPVTGVCTAVPGGNSVCALTPPGKIGF